MNDVIRVGMADYQICHSPQIISTLGLGSCLGVVLYDKTTKICGMAHVMMPDSTKISKNSNRMKFVDTCLPDMYDEMIRAGAKKTGIMNFNSGPRIFPVVKSVFFFIETSTQNSRIRLQTLRLPLIRLLSAKLGYHFLMEERAHYSREIR